MIQSVTTLKTQYPLTPQAAQLPATGFIKLPAIIGNPKAEPPTLPIIPVSRSTWLNGVKSGKYPKSYKLGKRATAWRVEDIRGLLEELGA